jgi:hypothetical protein
MVKKQIMNLSVYNSGWRNEGCSSLRRLYEALLAISQDSPTGGSPLNTVGTPSYDIAT